MQALVIDNDQNRIRSLRSIWASLGFKTADLEAAEDEENASALVKKKKYILIFIHQPGEISEATLGLLKEIRETARLKTVPVIVYSGSPSKENVVQAVQSGASTFLAFPFSVSDVEVAIKKLIKAGARPA